MLSQLLDSNTTPAANETQAVVDAKSQSADTKSGAKDSTSADPTELAAAEIAVLTQIEQALAHAVQSGVAAKATSGPTNAIDVDASRNGAIAATVPLTDPATLLKLTLDQLAKTAHSATNSVVDAALQATTGKDPASAQAQLAQVAQLLSDDKSQASDKSAQSTKQSNATATHGTDALQSTLPAIVGNSDPRGLEAQIKQPVGTPAWHDEVASKLTWMVDRGVQSGVLHLSPDHLGPVEVKISVHNDQVSVWFGASHADTRAALEQALPRLREMFASSGMSLADAGVHREPPRNAPRSQQGAFVGDSGFSSDANRVDLVSRVRGILDAYA